MKEMGWSWEELENAPVAIVETVLERVLARQHWLDVKAKMG